MATILAPPPLESTNLSQPGHVGASFQLSDSTGKLETCRQGRLFDLVWLLAWGLGSSLWCVTADQQLSATFDEPVYVNKGLERWRSGSTAGLMRMGTMPLPVDVQTLPLYLAECWHGAPWDA